MVQQRKSQTKVLTVAILGGETVNALIYLFHLLMLPNVSIIYISLEKVSEAVDRPRAST